MRKNDFYHTNDNEGYISRYIIYREADTVTVENKHFPDTVKNPKMYKFYLHVGNIPETIDAILFVLKAPMGRGESRHVHSFDEEVIASMFTERTINDIDVYTIRGKNESGSLRFNFDYGEIPADPEKRFPTPAMVWVMETLKEEYEEWKKEQG